MLKVFLEKWHVESEEFLWLEMSLPFVPFPGLEIVLPGKYQIGKIDHIIWVPDKEHFICDLDEGYTDDTVDDLLSVGWFCPPPEMMEEAVRELVGSET